MAKLNTYVSVHNREHGSVTFGPHDEVPGWAVPLITNPKVWDVAPSEPGVPVESGESDTNADESDDTGSEESEPEKSESSEGVSIPPVKGKGSSAAAWAAYAKSQGYEVDEDAKASEIREALVEAGVPVE